VRVLPFFSAGGDFAFKGADLDAQRHQFSIFDFRISILYPKMSLTLSKIEEFRSAGLLST
jgi:hypothetical protein